MTKYITYINVVLCTTISCTHTCKNRNQNDCHCVRAYMNIKKNTKTNFEGETSDYLSKF